MREKVNFITRLVSSLLLVPVAIYCLYRGGIFFNALVILFIFVGIIELGTIVTQKKFNISVVIAVVVAEGITLVIPYGSMLLWAILLVIGIAALILSIVLWWKPESYSREIMNMVFVTLYMGHVGATAILIRENPAGLVFWLLIVSATWTTDTLSYAGGRAYGKTKMASSISPNKTVEGAVTGIVFAYIVCFISLYVWHLIFPALIAIVIVAPFAALVGDLLISKLKRVYNIKDSSFGYVNIVPGHGGLMDRIDSLVMVIISTATMLIVFGIF